MEREGEKKGNLSDPIALFTKWRQRATKEVSQWWVSIFWQKTFSKKKKKKKKKKCGRELKRRVD